MDQFLEAARTIGARVVVFALGALGLVWLASQLLPRLALAATCFVATPGGLLIALLTWRYMRRRRRNG